MSAQPYSSEAPRAAVWGRDDLTCPLSRSQVARWVRHAETHPWRGDEPLLDRRHAMDTTAITEPGRLTRVLLSLDHGYHASGWFVNSDYERCLHLSVSHPRPERLRVYRHQPSGVVGPHVGIDLDVPTDDEARAWGRVVFRQHAHKAWFEPAVGLSDPYRSPGVVHLRLYLDQRGTPVIPTAEVYTLLPWEDGTSPKKVTEGRAGADVR